MRSRIAIAICLCAALAALAAMWLVRNFPFRRGMVLDRIQSATHGNVTFAQFHERWFPPGFDAAGIRATDDAGDVLTVDSLRLDGSYTGLLGRQKTIDKVEAAGVRLEIKRGAAHRRGSSPNQNVRFGQIHLREAALVLLPDKPAGQPLEFRIHDLAVGNAGAGRKVSFRVAMHNPKPDGEIRSRGSAGPFVSSDPGATPVAGEFTFENADITVDHAVTGRLNASGKFDGPLNRLAASGTADIPRFQVDGSSHTVHLATRFDVTVNALNGDTALNEIVTHFNRTTITARGTAAGSGARPGKTLRLDASVRSGRIDDILFLFSKGAAPMDGTVQFRLRFTVPPGPPGFLTKLQSEGEFAIQQAHFTNANAQTPVDRLSASAEGERKREQREHPTLAAAEVKGHVVDANGVARLSDVAFTVPGVEGGVSGTFDLRRKNLAFTGQLQTTGKLGDTTQGVKVIFAKAFEALLRKRRGEKVIPFRISGTASHPQFGLMLQH